MSESTLTITVDMVSLVEDIKVKSFMNTERIKESGDQYAVRADEENEIELEQCLQDAYRSLIRLCRRFLATSADTAANDKLLAATASQPKSLVFSVTSRRTSHIAESLSQAIHEYLVGGTLRRFYTSAAMSDLASLYLANEKNAQEDIYALLYRKAEPTYS